MGKGLNLYDNWVEYLALLFMIVGFLLMQINWIFSGSKITTYISIILIGIIVGRIFHKIDNEDKTRWVIISCGFLIGFLIGSHYGETTMIVILYLIGAYASFYLHDKGYIETVTK